MDGWFKEEECNQPSCSYASPRQRLSDLYRRPFCGVETGCAPGFAYKDGLDCLEVEEPQPMSSASTPTHRQFHQEADIKTAVFMGCKNGEIEVGMMPTASNINVQMGIRNMLTEEFVQQSSPLGEFFQPDQSWPSSSSSSLRSLSVSSPEYSSLILSKARSNTPHMPDANLTKTSIDQVITQPRSAQLVSPHQVTMQAYGQIRHVQFPTPTSDVDATMARAMIAVLSSSSSSSPQPNQARRRGGAFKSYDPSLFPKIEAKQASHGQGMIKRAFSILRQIRLMSAEARVQETRPGSNQLHHVISERKRREKLNHSFTALRAVLPPGTKRDKASVLASTIDYVDGLRAEISHLEEKNRLMEGRLLPPDETDEEDDASGERVRIRIDRAPESSSGLQRMELRVIAPVEYCDMIDLVLHILDCLKETRGIKLVSLDAGVHSRQMNPIRRAILTIQIKGDDWDEDSFKGAIARAVGEALPRPGTAAP